jgi:polyisoprenoid-binding protein YceI
MEEIMLKKFLGLALLLALALSAHAADTYVFGGKDASHSEVAFKISHWTINKVRGNFDAFDGSIQYDEKKPEKSKVEVSIEAASINTRNERRDKHLRSEDFFHVEKYPKLSFKSTKVEASADGKGLKVTGDLTMRGVTKSVVLEASTTGKIEDGMGKTRIGFEASTKVNRKDFGIAWNMSNKTGTAMLGDDVEILLSIEAIKQ